MKKFLKNFTLIAVAVIIAVCLCACGGGNKGKDNGKSLDTNVLTFEESMREDAVNWYGRYYYAKSLERVNLNNSAAGFEVRFSGTSLSMYAQAVDLEWEGGIVGSEYICVSIDGGAYVRKLLPYGTGETKLAEGLRSGVHTARVLKSTEASSNTWELEKITTDGSFYTPPERPKYTIEVYGDSISVGHSTLKTDTKDSQSSDMEDATKTYSFMAAEKIGGIAQIFGVSGQRVGDYGGGANNTIPTLSGKSDPAASGNRTWDRAAHPVDAVVIDLGTNDIIQAYNDGLSTDEAKEKISAGYKAFVRSLRTTYYPNAPVIIAHGTFNYASASWTGPAIQDYDEFFETLADELNTELGKVYGVQLNKCTYGHPSAADNVANSDLLVAVLRTALGIAA